MLRYEEPVDYDLQVSRDTTIKHLEAQNRFFTTLGKFLWGSIDADQIGFTVLPNREVCIAGIKLAGQRMPKDLLGQNQFYLSLWEWVAPVLQSCTASSNETRYIMVQFTKSTQD